METFTTEKEKTRALLVSVDTGAYDAESSLAELFELAESAGAEPVASVSQKLDRLDPASCVGSGKLLEIKDFCENEEIDLVIFDLELSPVQIRNIEDTTDVRVIDRTMLILDIFAQRAKSKEGKLQVELAQLKYMMPRLTGKGVAMSRLGGGIGTRGPGETKLETDRRHIKRRIESLKAQLKDVDDHRAGLRRRREKDGVITAAIVGYTNAGKSTLMNYLTDAGVLSKDMLFATLDPTSRALKLENGVSVMLIDTVGLVRRLPHHLVEAFKSTLEEAAEADIILNVCDASNEESALHLSVTEELLSSLGASGKPIISVLNKCDLIDPHVLEHVGAASGGDAPAPVRISAKTGEGIEDLLRAIEENLPKKVKRVKLLVPFDRAGLLSQIRSCATLHSEEYSADGIKAEATVDEILFSKVREFIIE